MRTSAKFSLLTDLRFAVQAGFLPTLSAILRNPLLLFHPNVISDLFMSYVWTAYGDSVDEGGRAVKEALITPQAYGVVLDIGAGHGHTVNYLDRTKVTKYIALEPNVRMHPRIRYVASLAGYTESTGTLLILPYPAESRPQILSSLCSSSSSNISPKSQPIDTIISILTLCSLPSSPSPSDVLTSLISALLKPGGVFLFYEHVLSPKEEVRWWQRFWTPVWRKAFGGCRLDRDTGAVVEAMGVRTRDGEGGVWADGQMWGKEGEDVDSLFWHRVGRFVKA